MNDAEDSADEATPAAPAAVPLLAPREGVPDVIVRSKDLEAAAEAIAAGTGPVAVDAERASGYRYGQRAYLVQLRREGAGSFLVDPTAFTDLAPLQKALEGTEWVLHAASQDLPCLSEIGLHPSAVFDTELAGRLTGHDRVGLGPLVAEMLGLALEKGHSAADWSTRPLPEPWLRYAALDVEVLVELRDHLEDELREQGKLEWALEEFEAVRTAPPPPPRVDPWRRTSGLPQGPQPPSARHRARALGGARRDGPSPRHLPRTGAPRRGGRRSRPEAADHEGGAGQPAGLLGPRHATRDRHVVGRRRVGARPRRLRPAALLGCLPTVPPPARAWNERNKPAADRLSAARAAVAAVAESHGLPTENLLTPDSLRRLCWTPPADHSADALGAVLRGYGAREWQVALTAPALAESFAAVAERQAGAPAEEPVTGE